MVNNVTTNPGALVALQNLNRITDQLAEVQRRVSTGKQVSSAKDNPAIYALAQQQRAELASIEPVQQGLRIGQSAVDVALAAGESISDILIQLKVVSSQAADPSLTTAQRDVLNDQFINLRDQITRLIDSADVGGRNLLAAGAPDLSVIASTDGTQSITVAAQDLTIGAGIINIDNTATPLASAAAAQAQIAAITTAIDALTPALAQLGSGSQSLSLQDRLIGRIGDALEISIGSLTDADLAKESSRLQALQVQQQLAIQTLSIANAAPNAILALFR